MNGCFRHRKCEPTELVHAFVLRPNDVRVSDVRVEIRPREQPVHIPNVAICWQLHWMTTSEAIANRRAAISTVMPMCDVVNDRWARFERPPIETVTRPERHQRNGQSEAVPWSEGELDLAIAGTTIRETGRAEYVPRSI